LERQLGVYKIDKGIAHAAHRQIWNVYVTAALIRAYYIVGC